MGFLDPDNAAVGFNFSVVDCAIFGEIDPQPRASLSGSDGSGAVSTTGRWSGAPTDCTSTWQRRGYG